MASSVQSRKDEILAKKARLAELKRQRELRQREFSSNRNSQNLSDGNELAQSSPIRSRNTQSREDIDSLISSILPDQSISYAGSRTPGGRSPAKRASGIDQVQAGVEESARKLYHDAGTDTQTLSFTGSTTVYEIPVESKPEVITYSKGVQTSDAWSSPRDEASGDDTDASSRSPSRRRRRNLSDRERELQEEEMRQRLRVEIEEELKALQLDEKDSTSTQRFPARALAPEELNAVTTSTDFQAFIERSSKVIERALDEEYDLLADYALQSRAEDSDDEDASDYQGRKGRRIKEIASFALNPELGANRMVSALDFSPKFPELLCASYTKSQTSPHSPAGLLNVWNLHLKGRPEYSLTATSDLLSCLFHPHHPSLILGGTYSGQLCLWDVRARSQHTGAPVQQTPLTGGRTGHAHPIYSLAVVGTPNASSIVSVSTDGVVCAWSADMLTLPQEKLTLHAPAPFSVYKTDDVAPTCLSFPAADPTMFLAGTEQGAILPVHRYDRAGSQRGVDPRTSYQAHMGPVTAVDHHPARGKSDLSDLFVSSGMDWSIKLWRAQPPSASSSTTITGQAEVIKPLMEIQREDTVYDVRWHPHKPSIFASVDGSGSLDVWDITTSTDLPVASARASHHHSAGKTGFGAESGFGGGAGLRSLNKVAWEKGAGRNLAVGGLDGVTTVFEVGTELGGLETKGDAWGRVRKWVGRQGQGRREGGDS